MKKLIFIFLALCMIGGICYSQVPVKRKKPQKTEQPQSSDNRRKQEAEAKRQREAEAKRKQEAEARLQREAEVKRKQQEEARLQREAEAKRKQEEEAKRNETGMINGHEWVDLGLPSGLKWATTNVGASSPSDYGNYYAWGETTTKSSYMGGNSQTYRKGMTELRLAGIIGTSGTLTMTHDAARANWDGSWRMPTRKELVELEAKCTWTWTSQEGHSGYKVTGPNGRTIFVPAAGWRDGISLDETGERGYYWSSTLYGTNNAYCLCFGRYGRSVIDFNRNGGRTVRPVSE